MKSVLFILGVSVWLGACASQSLTLVADQTADVSYLNFADGRAVSREPLGKTPLTLPRAQVAGRMIEIRSTDSKPFVLFVPAMDGAANELKVQLEAAGTPTGKSDEGSGGRQSQNKVMRLLVKACQALYENKTDVALELARQAMEIDPEAASPLLIKGLAEIQSGQLDQAKASLTAANRLDPEDSDITAMLNGIP